jgi:glucokinase
MVVLDAATRASGVLGKSKRIDEQLTINFQKMQKVIGIDIGGTKIDGILFDGKKVVKELKILTPKSAADFAYDLKHLAAFLALGQKIKGIGIGMAGVIDVRRQAAVYSPNIKFINNFDFKKVFGKKIKIAVANDAKCFALAEACLGQGKNYESVVGVILGTGVGSGLVLNGKIYTGHHYGAGEVGQMFYDGKHTFESLFQKARNRKNNKELAHLTGILLGNIYRVLDPELIVLGGGVALDRNRKFIEEAEKICADLLSNYHIKPSIVVSKLKNAGVLGAALLIK